MTFVELQPEIAARDKLKHCPPVELHVMQPNETKHNNSFNPLKQDPCMPLNLFSEAKAFHTSQTKIGVSHKNLLRSKSKLDLSYPKNLMLSKTKLDLSSSQNLTPPFFNAPAFAKIVRSLQN
jgi:hypothetical protein